jgi:hypothetical protein
MQSTLLRALITLRHWQRFETFTVQFRRAARELAEKEGEPAIAQMTVSSRQFERWYSGNIKTAPHPDSCRVLEYMFGYPVRQLLGPAGRTTDHAEPGTLERRQSSPVIAEHRSTLIEPSAIWALGYDEEPARYQPRQPADAMEYRGLSEPERMIAMAARRALRFGTTADASNISHESLDQLMSETGRLAVAYIQQPLAAILGDIVDLQDHTFRLLEGRQRPRETRDLYIVGGIASGMLAKAAHDLHDPQMAMTHARTALLCARNAEQNALTAWINGLQSLITYWADRPREALRYAQAGQEIGGLTGTVSVWLASLEARAWSALGNGQASREAIERAADLRERVLKDDLDDLGGMCRFSVARQLYYAADASASLLSIQSDDDSARRTEAQAIEAIAAYENAPAGEQSFSDQAGSRTDLAIARIRCNEIEGAREAIEPVLSLPPDQRIHGVVTSVISVHRAVTTQFSGASDGHDIQEEIEEYCRRPAAALPR